MQPPTKPAPCTQLTSNLEGAKTDSELSAALLAYKSKTVSARGAEALAKNFKATAQLLVWQQIVVKYGSSFCYHCQQMLPHFLKLSNEVSCK